MVKIIIGIAAVLLLVAPAALQAFVWTPINLLAAILAVTVFVAIVKFKPGWKWPIAIAASLPIVVAPYPNWIWASNDEGWQFHVGYKLQHITDHAIQFGFFFAIALLLFLALSWAMKPSLAARSPRKSD